MTTDPTPERTLENRILHWLARYSSEDLPALAMADDLIASLSAAGFRVVPAEPAEEMLEADAHLADLEASLPFVDGRLTAARACLRAACRPDREEG